MDAGQGQGAAVPVAGSQSKHAQLRQPELAWPRVPSLKSTQESPQHKALGLLF